MLTKLSQLRELLDKDHKPKKLVLAASEDAHSLSAVVHAAEQEIIRLVLVEIKNKQQAWLKSLTWTSVNSNSLKQVHRRRL